MDSKKQLLFIMLLLFLSSFTYAQLHYNKIILPVEVNTSLYVPYTGATGNVDLNNKDLVNINNVGIGTSNPTFPNRDSKLVIEGSGTGTTGRTAFVVRNTATDSAASFILANSDENSMSAQVSGSSYVGGEKAGFSTTGLNLSFGVDGNMRDGGTHTISFTTGGWANNPTMTITPGNPGAVGIGTTSAVYKNGWAERSIQIHTLKKGSPGGLSYGAETIDDTYSPDFSFLRQRAGNTKVEDGDRIGSLNAYGYVGSYYRYMGGINIEVDGATITDQRAPSRIIFKTGELDTSAVEVMRIDSSGNVGIGTTTPTEVLEVNGNIFLNGDNQKLLFGVAKDSSIYYDGSDMIFNPKEVGSGQMKVLGDLNVTGNTKIYGNVSFQNPHLNAFDNSTQNFLTLGTAQPMNLTSDGHYHSHQINIINNNNLTFDRIGHYELCTSPQFYQASGINKEIEFWLEMNGVGVEWTNSRYTMDNEEHTAPHICWEIQITNPLTEYAQIMWVSDSTSSQLISIDGLINPTRPSIPSVIMDVEWISNGN